MTYAEFEQTPIENVQRGTIVALVTIPLGVIVWVILWNIGFVASIVAFGAAYLAVRLYRWGSGGPISRTGAIRITVITIVTMLIALFAGIVSDAAQSYSSGSGESALSEVLSPEFWRVFWHALAQPGVLSGYAPSIILALLFGAIGCFSTLRNAFRQANPEAVAAARARAAQDPMRMPLFPSNTPQPPVARPTTEDAPPVPPAPLPPTPPADVNHPENDADKR
jgi:hypothetical protein